MEPNPIEAAEHALRSAGSSDIATETFLAQLRRLQAGEQGVLPESSLQPVDDLPDADALPETSPERLSELIDRAVVIKLNGGLGTSMGLAGPKSLLPVKQGLTFLDVIARQMLALRDRHGARLPLVLMHSFATQEESLQALSAYPELLDQDVPIDFLQNRVPKLEADSLCPVEHPDAPELTWAPPGHGDLYTALMGSGQLDALLAAGYRYAFVSNVDNLGATLEARLLGWFADSGAPFAMEAADRTAADRKGGHLARNSEGGLVLREVAQTPDEDLAAFQDITRHRYFNTNNLWLDLQALHATLTASDHGLALPLIVNRKTVDPADSTSTPVLQLETAMGSAISSWPDSQAIRVPRSRFGPVKTTADLLAVRSDAYLLSDDGQITLAEQRAGTPPLVDLDSGYYKFIADFDARFDTAVPSLLSCETLTVNGDIRFGVGITVHGTVTLDNPGPEQLVIEDGAVLGQ